MSAALNNFVGNDLGCAGVAQHMLNIADEQQILVRFVDVIQRFRKFAFDFKLLRRNLENVMKL